MLLVNVSKFTLKAWASLRRLAQKWWSALFLKHCSINI